MVLHSISTELTEDLTGLQWEGILAQLYPEGSHQNFSNLKASMATVKLQPALFKEITSGFMSGFPFSSCCSLLYLLFIMTFLSPVLEKSEYNLKVLAKCISQTYMPLIFK